MGTFVEVYLLSHSCSLFSNNTIPIIMFQHSFKLQSNTDEIGFELQNHFDSRINRILQQMILNFSVKKPLMYNITFYSGWVYVMALVFNVRFFPNLISYCNQNSTQREFSIGFAHPCVFGGSPFIHKPGTTKCRFSPTGR